MKDLKLLREVISMSLFIILARLLRRGFIFLHKKYHKNTIKKPVLAQKLL